MKCIEPYAVLGTGNCATYFSFYFLIILFINSSKIHSIFVKEISKTKPSLAIAM